MRVSGEAPPPHSSSLLRQQLAVTVGCCCFLLVTATTTANASAEASAAAPCIVDPLNPRIVGDRNLTYAYKLALSTACTDSMTRWERTVQLLTTSNTTEVELPPKPVMPPLLEMYPKYISPRTPSCLFSFQHSAVKDIVDAALAGVRCGFECSSSSPDSASQYVIEGEAIAARHVVGYRLVNVTNRINGTTTYVTYQRNESITSNATADMKCLMNLTRNNNDNYYHAAVAVGSVCAAYIQYNSSYWENGTVYVDFPMDEVVAVLDASTVTLSVGVSPSPLWIWLAPELQHCPWFYRIPDLSKPAADGPSILSQVTPLVDIHVQVSQSSAVPLNESLIIAIDATLTGAVCEVVTTGHPLNDNGSGVRIRGVLLASQVGEVDHILYPRSNTTAYRISLPAVRLSYVLLPTMVTNADCWMGGTQGHPLVGCHNCCTTQLSAAAAAPAALLRYEGELVTLTSTWRPFENYSQPDLANTPRRCYATSPVMFDGSPTTLYLPTLVCATTAMILNVEVLNTTAFCCVANSTSTPFVWDSYIQVYDTGVRWFTDRAGIAAPPPAPTHQGMPPPTTHHYDSSGGRATESGSSRGGSGSDDVATLATYGSPSSESSALVMGVCMVAIGGVAAALAVLYFKWWRPRHSSGGQFHKGIAFSVEEDNDGQPERMMAEDCSSRDKAQCAVVNTTNVLFGSEEASAIEMEEATDL